jgi:enoyl-CoA hydratase/carnithine racemase
MDVELADGVTIVRIDHPRVNAFDLGQVDDAVATVRSIKGPIVLTGAGPCFSAGVDLRAIIDGGPDYTDRS